MVTTAAQSTAQPKRRWPRFSLRALLMVVTLIAIWLAIEANQAHKQAAAIKAAQELGAFLRFDYEYDSAGHEMADAKPWAPSWLRAVFGEDYFRTVVTLDFSSAIHRVRDPQAIDFTRRALAVIDDLPSLRTLELSDNSQIDDASLPHLSHLSQLRELYLYRTNVRGPGLQHLLGCSKLEYLHLDRTPLGDEGLQCAAKLTNLHSLILDNSKITDAGLAYLSHLPAIHRLSLQSTDVTDDGLTALKPVKSLMEFWADRTNVTSAGLSQLQQALPKCSIFPTPQSLDQRPHDFPLWDAGVRPTREDVLAKVKEWKGDVQFDSARAGQPMIGLRIFDISISDSSLLALVAEMPELERLNLRHLLVGDALAEGLTSYPKLREIHIQDTRIGDDALRHLAQLSQLEDLDLQETRISDRGLVFLKQSQSLRRLNVINTRATPAGVDDLRKALPQCRISY